MPLQRRVDRRRTGANGGCPSGRIALAAGAALALSTAGCGARSLGALFFGSGPGPADAGGAATPTGAAGAADGGALLPDGGAADAGAADGGALAGTPDAGPYQTFAGCRVFPPDNEFNRDVSNDPVDPHSNEYLAHMNANTLKLHADFGSNPTYGMPYVIVSGNQPKVPMKFTYAHDSDPGPYPFPPDIPIQAGEASTGDRHAMAIDKDNCISYETWSTYWKGDHFECGSGAIFDLKTNPQRPQGWTSATAAGLPIVAGLERYHEVVELGEVNHAVTFNVGSSAAAYVHPATHHSGTSTDPFAPPMGLRVRLRADYDLSRFHGAALVILKGLRKYGMFVVDNGADWFISGEKESRWDDNDLNQLKTVPGSAFEVVRLGQIRH
ncbi:MAG: hypothetical protein NVSMB23_23670 [Myxococcales bacterium]